MSKHFFFATSDVVLITLFALLFGCGSGSGFLTTRLLVVDDGDNNRVLIHDAPLSTSQTANVVLGQPNLTTRIAAMPLLQGGLYSTFLVKLRLTATEICL